jgi:hypothetical protein
MERLFHVSDNAGIELFAPRPARDGQPYVWAVAESRLHNYLLPRDCPRVTFYAGPDTSVEDRAKFFAWTEAEFIIAVEKKWGPAILSEVLYLYEFEPEGFRLYQGDAVAQHFVCDRPVTPLNCTTITNLLSALLTHNVELRFMPSLWALREAVIHSSLPFSIIRMRNAAPPLEGMTVYTPLP